MGPSSHLQRVFRGFARLGSVVLLVLASAARAYEPHTGSFVAHGACPATRAIAAPTSDSLRLRPGARYQVLGLNKAGGAWVQVRPSQEAQPRWVARDCGTLESGAALPVRELPPESTRAVLALSWQPAFCASDTGRDKPECRALNRGQRGNAPQLTLHGLWPEHDDYCDAPALKLSPATQDALRIVMPGVASGLDRHEWRKHGSCHNDPKGAEGYFRDSLHLVQQVHASGLSDWLRAREGRRIPTTVLRAEIARALGAGAEKAAQITCRTVEGDVVLAEIRLGLSGQITPEARLATLMRDGARFFDGAARTNRRCRGTLKVVAPGQ